MTLPESDPGLDRALAHRAVARPMRNIAISGGALGVLALAFIVVADGHLDATSIPQLGILGLGWLTGIIVPSYCVRLQSAVHRGRLDPFEACARLDGVLRGTAIGLPVCALVLGIAMVALVEPTSTTVLSVAVSLAIVSQLVAVLVAVRPGVRRAARRLA